MYFDENHEAYIVGFHDGLELAKSYMQGTMNKMGDCLYKEEYAERAYMSRRFKNEKRSTKEVENSAIEYLKAEAKQAGLTVEVVDKKELCGKPIDLISNEGWALRWYTTNGTLMQFRDDENAEYPFFKSCRLLGDDATESKCTIQNVEGVIPFIQEHIDVIRKLQRKAQRRGA